MIHAVQQQRERDLHYLVQISEVYLIGHANIVIALRRFRDARKPMVDETDAITDIRINEARAGAAPDLDQTTDGIPSANLALDGQENGEAPQESKMIAVVLHPTPHSMQTDLMSEALAQSDKA
ncbi:hypothetical protein PG984_010237 [Apiospora sp. TS-2023a]